ncbi:MAG: zinc ribbon domain-containing protein [Chloroflexota bacterium]
MAQEKHYEMLWDCKFCGTAKNLGKTHRFCPNCGAAQDPDSRYFPSDEEKVAVEDHVYVGKDRICPACGSLNSASAHNCGACGSPLDEAAVARTLQSQSRAAGAAFASSGSRDMAQEQFEREMAAAGIETPAAAAQGKKGGLNRRFIVTGTMLAVAALFGFVFWLTSQTQEQTVLVTGHAWEREIRVEEYQTVRDEDWDDQVPAAAYNERCTQRQRDTRRVADGQTCRTVRTDNGDGTFSEREECTTNYREEPVMDDFCTYDIDRWEYERSVTTEGDALSPAPQWGNLNLRECNTARLGCEREEGRNQRYSVTFRDEDGDTHTCTYPENQWASIGIETRWSMEIRQFVGGAVCSSLAPAG